MGLLFPHFSGKKGYAEPLVKYFLLQFVPKMFYHVGGGSQYEDLHNLHSMPNSL